MGRLQDRVCAITGGASGIGLETARLFANEGADIVLMDVNDDAGLAAAKEIEADFARNCRYLTVDVTDEGATNEAFGTITSNEGKLDILVACAGGPSPADGPLHELDGLEAYDTTFAVDVRGTLLSVKAALPLMIENKNGSIVTLSSSAALMGYASNHVYSAAKAAVNGITRAIAGKYARDGVRANAIAPGIVMTQRMKNRLAKAEAGNDETYMGILRSYDDHPFGIGDARDIANIALFLASDESRMITGSVLAAEGGLSAY